MTGTKNNLSSRIACNEPVVIASPPNPGQIPHTDLEPDPVIASPSMNSGQAKARQSMQCGVMDCFTAFAMTATFTMTRLFMERSAATRQSRESGTSWIATLNVKEHVPSLRTK